MLRALAAIWLIWGLNWVVMKSANTYFPPILFVAWRFGSGALILLAVAYWRKIPLPDAKFLPWIILTGLFQLTLNNVTAQVGMQSISAGMAAVLNYTAPLWTAILAHFALNERLTRIKLFGVLLAIVGLYVLMGLQGVEDLTSAFIIISGAVCMACSNIIVKLRLTKCDMVQLTTWQMVFGAAALIIYVTLFPQGDINWCLPAVLCVLYNGALASALAFFLWNYVLSHIEASTASIATLVAPVVGVLGGVAILGEPFTAYIVLGIVLIFAGILIVVKARG
ncbi:MAG: DMT family transporter [Quinella sp. 1Q7]|nr:DMT family transporter [Quinella sp. 1Q7]